MTPQIFAAFSAELEKIALVFGGQEPRISDTEVPYKTRKTQLLSYAQQKAKEPKTPWSTALLTGAGIGAAVVGGGSAISVGRELGGARALQAAAVGGTVGAIGGSLIGALMKYSDDHAIRNARHLLKPTTNVDGAIADRIVAQKRARESDQYWREERRHQQMLNLHHRSYLY